MCSGKSEPNPSPSTPSRRAPSTHPRNAPKPPRLSTPTTRPHDISQPLDDRFAALAQTRIETHPLRYYVWVPVLRVADMWLRPRTEGIPISPSWWRWNDHPGQSAAALALGLLNLGYILLALGGAMRKPPLAIFLASYMLLRSLLLATLENPEPRYTLEAFPIVFVLGAILLGGGIKAGAPPSRS